MKFWKVYFELLKMLMSLLISFSAVFGYVLQSARIDLSLILTATGIFITALGSAALNNYQDRNLDRAFSRTRYRVLPAGKLPPGRALGLSITLIILGTAMLYQVHLSLFPPLLGISAVLLYNGIYTPLKRASVLAIIPGALCGMMPPLIGWTAAGGSPLSIEIISVMVFFGLWQLPHFWLILLTHCTEYQACDIPNMLRQFSRSQLTRLTFIWIVNFSITGIFISFLFWENCQTGRWIFTGISFLLIASAGLTLFTRKDLKNQHYLSLILNSAVFLFMLFVIVDRMMVSA